MKKILVAVPFNEEQKNALRAVGAGCEFVFKTPAEVTEEDANSSNIIIGNIPAALLKAPQCLEWMQLNSAGADSYVKPGILAETTLLTNASGAYDISVAEHALALYLMLCKKLYVCRDAQNRSEWTRIDSVDSPFFHTVVITGFGNIGRSCGRMCKALGCRVIGIVRSNTSNPGDADEIYTTDKIDEVLPRADAVISFLPGTAESKDYFNAKRLALMKPSAFLINCGRGNSVNPDALYDALLNGKIAAAALDVTEPEPLPADSPMWKLPNLVISPHSAGGYRMDYTVRRIADIAGSNLAKFLAGEKPDNIVDKKLGY